MLEINPIGVVHSPFKKKEDVPIQPCFSKEVGRVEVFPEFSVGLMDIEGFSHLILLHWFHETKGWTLLRKPYLDAKPHGIFSIRHPARPNPIGVSTVKLKKKEGSVLIVEGIDVLDKTPLIDIKPYVPKFDMPPGKIKIGWLEGWV
jgi:tRNA-Thr(GGU) m(6)t(6)A37 methyltransferase TsaA